MRNAPYLALMFALLGFPLAGCSRPKDVPEASPPQSPSSSNEQAGSAQSAPSERQEIDPPSAVRDSKADNSAAGHEASARGETPSPSPSRGAPASASVASRGLDSPSPAVQAVSAAEAASQGQSALETARSKESAGKTKEAFTAALKGYQAMRSHKDDATCQQISSQLLEVLERTGEKQHRSTGTPSLQPYKID